MNKGKVILLNGGIGVGKDTIAHALCSTKLLAGPTYHHRVKDVLWTQALSLSQIPEGIWWKRYYNRELKELPWDRLGGLSVREFLIKISEEYVKPVFGSSFYGKIAGEQAARWTNLGTNIVFSDGGFQDEFDAIAEAVGKENIHLIRLHRDGCSFKGDSRSFLKSDGFEIDVSNNSTIENTVSYICTALNLNN